MEESEQFHIKLLEEEYDDAPEILEEIVDIFLDETPGRLEAMREGLEHQDMSKVAHAAHKLANTSGTLKAHTALSAARELEHHARAKRRDEAETAGRVLQKEMGHVIETLEQWRRERPPVDNTEA